MKLSREKFILDTILEPLVEKYPILDIKIKTTSNSSIPLLVYELWCGDIKIIKVEVIDQNLALHLVICGELKKICTFGTRTNQFIPILEGTVVYYLLQINEEVQKELWGGVASFCFCNYCYIVIMEVEDD